MAFEGLSEKLQNTFKKLRGKGALTEKDIKATMREVKLALLEADVNFKVVKDFIGKVTERAIGQEVMSSLTPGQQVIKIVHEEMIRLMGGDEGKTGLTYSDKGFTVMMLVGLQGAGKTTMAAKLAGLMKKDGKRPLLVACDVYRPAAVKQLQVVGGQVGVPVFEMGTDVSPVEIAARGVEAAQRQDCNVVLIDTAGRLHIDEELMDELRQIKAAVDPSEILLVVDAMTGQDAVNVAASFDEMLNVSGVILTKLDGDTRGGAALSIRAVTGKPVKFSGIGEKLTDIEAFYPDRMASRILGMGDVLSLIEKASQAIDEEKAAEVSARMMSNDFGLDDLLESMQQVKKMGNMNDLLSMMPGMGGKLKDVEVDDKALGRTEAMIRSMTPFERRHPDVLNASRKRRIVKGAGVTIQELNQLLKQYDQSKQMMKQFSGAMKGKRRGGLGGLFGGKNPFGL